MAGKVMELLTFGLPLTYYDDYVQRVMAVTAADVQRAARTYLEPDQTVVVVVGDLASIRASVDALGLGASSIRDISGQPAAN
jgi:zinc protease